MARSAFIINRLPPLPSLRDIIKLYKINAQRELSQNFLLNERLTDKIVRCAGYIQDTEICEVGPGPGNITRSIINQAAEKIVLIEKDRRFIPILEMLKEAAPQPIEIIQGDVLSFNMECMFSEDKRKVWEEDHPKIQIIGNLPFGVSTPLIIKWIQAIANKENVWKYGRVRMTLTFQEEFAERMTAPIMTAQRCRLSVMCQNWCDVQHRFTIPGTAFLPKPNVNVGVVHLKPLIKPIIQLPFALVERVTRCLFMFRQKYSYKGIQRLFPENVQEKLTDEMYKMAEIDPQNRSFQLTIPEIGRLCHSYKTILKRAPQYIKYNSHQKKSEMDWLAQEEEQEEKIIQWKLQNNIK